MVCKSHLHRAVQRNRMRNTRSVLGTFQFSRQGEKLEENDTLQNSSRELWFVFWLFLLSHEKLGKHCKYVRHGTLENIQNRGPAHMSQIYKTPPGSATFKEVTLRQPLCSTS